jgi:peptidyl-prolyl cis-trans isomerase SurA
MNLDAPLLQGCSAQGGKHHAAVKLLALSIWIVFLLVGGLRAELVDRIVAIVNNDIILLSELDQTLADLRATLDKQGYSQSQKEQILKQQRSNALEKLIYDKLTDQQVQRHNIKIDDSEVDATIQRIKKINRMSDDDLRRNLESDGMSYDDYRKQIKDKMLRSRLVNREVKSKIVITDEDIKAYYDAHLDEYGGHTKYELRHILIKISPSADSTEKERARQKIDNIYNKLQQGGSFEQLAEEYSEAPSAAHNGRLGIFDLNILSDQIKQALKGLEAKHFSKVVDTDQGYQIFYIESVIQSGGKGIDEVRDEIQEKLFANVVDQKFNEWIKDLRQRSHIQIME